MVRHSETLALVPLFRSLDKAAINALDRQCTWRTARANDWVVDHGESGTDLYFVARGHLRVRIRSVGGREIVLRDIRDGEYFGELAAIDGQPRSAGIQAVTQSVIARMAPAVLRAAVYRHPDVCDQLMALLASQVRSLARRVSEFSTLDIPHRLYAELLRLARPGSAEMATKAAMTISPPPTHADLAGRISSRREAVTRELNALERQGLIERRRGALILCDPARLAARIAAAEQ